MKSKTRLLQFIVFSGLKRKLVYTKDRAGDVVTSYVFLLISILYAFLIPDAAFYIRQYNPESFGHFFTLIVGGLSAAALMRGFFPAFTPVNRYLQPHHPVSAIEAGLVNGLSDLFSTSFLFLLLPALGLCFHFSFEIAPSLFITATLLAVFFSNHSLRSLVSYEEKPLPFLVLSIIPLLLLSFAASIVPAGRPDAASAGLAVTALTSGYGFNLWIQCRIFSNGHQSSTHRPFNKRTAKNDNPAAWQLLWKAFWRNGINRTPLLMALGMKLLLLLSFGWGSLKGSGSAFDQPLMWVFLSPAIYFSYIFNNLFAALRPVTFWVYTRHGGGLKKLLTVYIMVTAPVLVFDFFVSAFCLFLMADAFLPSLFVYLSLTLFCLCGGLAGSVIFPKKINKETTFLRRPTTNTLVNLIQGGLLVFLILYFDDKEMIVPALLLSLLIIGALSFYPRPVLSASSIQKIL